MCPRCTDILDVDDDIQPADHPRCYLRLVSCPTCGFEGSAHFDGHPKYHLEFMFFQDNEYRDEIKRLSKEEITTLKVTRRLVQ